MLEITWWAAIALVILGWLLDSLLTALLAQGSDDFDEEASARSFSVCIAVAVIYVAVWGWFR